MPWQFFDAVSFLTSLTAGSDDFHDVSYAAPGGRVDHQPARGAAHSGLPVRNGFRYRNSRPFSGADPAAADRFPPDFDCIDVFRAGRRAHADFCYPVQYTTLQRQAPAGAHHSRMNL